MTIEFLAEAREEFYEAVAYYELRQTGLGLRFAREIMKATVDMGNNPGLYRERPGGFRRMNLHVFPYYLAFFIRRESLIIAAVAHASRSPRYWRDRI